MNRWFHFGIWTALSFASDLGTKLWARKALTLHEAPRTFLDGFWDWQLSENEGSAFGMFRSIPGSRHFLTVIGFIALVVVVGYVRKINDSQRALAAALGMVAGGAVGNILDRLIYGKVTDFVLWHYGEHRWPTFNVADAWLVAGVALLLLVGGKHKAPAEKTAKAE